ncbi:TPA: MATE family efflux transporter [Klebsiella oxytoca]|uniref:MATE family efflux transporter n=1 Tax=Klebsiella oxytoca TaxID=571 RepID=UPI0022454572|nr:MATE family efflux transporter [Klebsiella oxytoca]EKU2384055.1 hypothetical protein [Klebsiella oxytoca]ELR9653683.1 hypothetical protein [Klebsiella oxytoca]MCW9518859.1 MATE family efflux transporter [Klebsiella oxytoca]MCW9628627.1 MATE family efflux transporter [Klebsiella oxytoca]HBM7349479.1 hypothetical protein [Klebsiella oxytoca]
MTGNNLIFKNTFFLAFRTGLSLLVSLYTTRIILEEMGVSGYGLFSVIYGAVGFFTFIVLAMNDSVQRFLSVKIGNNDYNGVRNVFKNGFLIYLLFGLALVSTLFFFQDKILEQVLNVSPDSASIANKVYTFAALSIFILVIQTPFNALVLSFERMSFYAYMSIYDACSKLLLAFAISNVDAPDKVSTYSFLLFISSVIGFLIYFSFCFYNFKKYLKGGRFNWSVIKDLYSFSFWNVLGGFASVSRIQGINILLNIFFSTTVNAAFAISNTVLNAINLLTQSLITAIRPQIFKSFAASDMNRYNTLILFGSKFTFIFLSMISLPLIINAQEILLIWLKNTPQYGVVFVRTIVIMALIDCLSFSIMAGIQATGRIKAYQLLVGLVIFMNLPISFFLLNKGYGPQSIAIPLIATSLINLNLRVYFLVSKGFFSFKKYYSSVVLPSVIPVIISFAVLFVIKMRITLDNAVLTILYSIFCSAFTMLLIWLMAFSPHEKKIIYQAVTKVFRIFKNDK